MAIKNYICLDCSHYLVCKIANKLEVFSEDAKKDLGVDIEILNCKEYKQEE